MSDILESAGAGTAAGGLVTWLISYIKNRDLKKEISKRVHKDTYEADQIALNDKIKLITDQHGTVCNIRTDALQQQLNDFKELQIRMDNKLDKLIERRSGEREGH
ncbi:MAG: DUF2200 family protein [Deltaproteobacteria bacterium]|nr:DUF2200 family protein [Deltaproteobacteria bacterium]